MEVLFRWTLLAGAVAAAAAAAAAAASSSHPNPFKYSKLKQWSKWMSRSSIQHLNPDVPISHFLVPHPHEPLVVSDEATLTAVMFHFIYLIPQL